MSSQVLGERYEVQRQLGKRAGRQTLLARDLKTQEFVVIKLLRFDSDFEWEHLKLFEREAETLKSLSHPAIPRYLDYFELDSPDGKGFALVQTYVEGQSLETQLKAGRTFGEAELKQLAKSLLKILISLHGRQPPVIHRDIKPGNILLTNRSGNSVGQVYLVDFGSVQTLAATEGGTITVVGTYGYMPPEQFGGRTVPASDLYSLGATLIYLATGTHPADLPQRDGRIQFEQKSRLTATMNDWLRWMTQPSLDRRLSSAEAAFEALEQPQPKNRTYLLNSKPAESKVSLLQDEDSLEVIIPLPEAKILTLALGLVIFIISTMVVLAMAVFINAFGFFFVFLPAFFAFFGMLLDIPPASVGRTRLRINQKYLSATYELFGFKKQRFRPILRQDISRLELEYTGNDKPRMMIWVEGQKYQLKIDNLLTEPELHWLANELSRWLGLPITRKQLISAE